MTTLHTIDKTVFLIGPTGYIGGTVLLSILSSPHPPKSITLLIRDANKANDFQNLDIARKVGTEIKILIGSLEDFELLTKATSEHDITVHCADSNHLESTLAMLAGQKIREERTGVKPIFIETSGCGCLIDDAVGEKASEVVYTDFTPSPNPTFQPMDRIPPNAPHRPVDLAVLQADIEGYITSYIILPSVIWGEGQGEVYEKGLSNSFSIQLPHLMRAALDRGRAGMIGEGKNIWPHINLNDLAQLYQLIYTQATISNPMIGHGVEGFYLGISGEFYFHDANLAIGRSMIKHNLGSIGESEPTTFTYEEMNRYYGGSYAMGTNSRGVAERAKSIGWTPKYTELEDLWRYIDSETVRVYETFGREWKGRELAISQQRG